MSNNENEEENFNRENMLLELMLLTYKNEEQRHLSIDNKCGSLIAFLGTMMTIQSTFGVLFLQMINIDVKYLAIISLFFIISLSKYGFAIYNFVNAYKLQEFHRAPSIKKLDKYANEGTSREWIAIQETQNIKAAIEYNDERINYKSGYMDIGFHYLNRGILFTILFIIVLTIFILMR